MKENCRKRKTRNCGVWVFLSFLFSLFFSLSSLVEEAEDLTTSVALAGFFVVDDTEGGGEDDVAELTGGEDVLDPGFELADGGIVTGRDGTALVEATVEVDDDLAGAAVINELEVINVALLLHDLEELNDDLGDRADDNLALTVAFSVGDGLEGASQNGHHSHFVRRGCEII